MSLDAIAGQLGLALDALAPAGCASKAAVIGVGATAPLTEEEITLTASWAPPRRHEFAAGRRCARQALAALGAVAGDDALLPDGEGIPAWPRGFLGSISHSRGVAMALVAPIAAYSLLGLDLEKTNRLSQAAVRRVVHPLEEEFAGGDQLRASVLFSLKEAFYKAQFPRWRTAGNFSDLALNVDSAVGTATVAEMDARFAPELRDMHFAFRLVDTYVISLCWRQSRESRPTM
jgi:4'-phosphopantetheinyl transferase EntD